MVLAIANSVGSPSVPAEASYLSTSSNNKTLIGLEAKPDAELEPTIKAEDEATLNELTPPLHFNCRTLMVFLTKDDQPIQWSTEGDLSEIIAMASMTE